MAQKILTRAPRAVGTLTGGPVPVMQFPAGSPVTANRWVSAAADGMVDHSALDVAQTGEVDTAVFSGVIKLVGLTLAAQSTVGGYVPVALAGPQTIFEANLSTSTLTGTYVPETLDAAILFDRVALFRYTVIEGGFDAVSNDTNNPAGAIVDINFGYVGESPEAGHGVLTDTNVRVRFIIDSAITLFGAIT